MALGAIIGGIGGIFGPKQKSHEFRSENAIKHLASYRENSLNALSDLGYSSVDPRREAAAGLDYNLGNMGAFQTLATQANDTAVSEKLKALSIFSPAYQTERDQASNINQSWMRGEVGADVQGNLARNAALSSVVSGQSSNPSATRGVLARDLGLTGTQLQQQGQAESRSWTELNNSLIPQQVSALDVMELNGLSTGQALQTAISNAQGKLNADVQATVAEVGVEQNLVEGSLSVLDKLYSTALTKSGVEHQNAMAPWKGAASIGAGVSSLFGMGSGGGGMGFGLSGA